MALIEVSDDELDVLNEYREKRESLKLQRGLQLEILKQAYEYEKWLRENGCGSTYSTFCDDYGYPEIKNRKLVFEAIEEIRKQAWVKAAP